MLIRGNNLGGGNSSNMFVWLYNWLSDVWHNDGDIGGNEGGNEVFGDSDDSSGNSNRTFFLCLTV